MDYKGINNLSQWVSMIAKARSN